MICLRGRKQTRNHLLHNIQMRKERVSLNENSVINNSAHVKQKPTYPQS